MGDFRDFYLAETGKRITAEKLGEKLGLSRATMTRRLTSGDRLSAEEIIALSRELKLPVIRALIDQGKLTPDEVYKYATEQASDLSSATNQQILDEIVRRSDPEARVLFGGDGYDNVLDLPEKQNPGTPLGATEDDDDEIDHDEIIRQINAGEIQVAAQKATDPLEEHFT